MNSEYVTAGNGLKKMFIGEIVALISALVAFIPVLGLLGIVGTIVGAVIILVGLNATCPAHDNYKNALYMVIAGIVLNILSGFLGAGIFKSLVVIVSSIVAFLQTYFICTASGELLAAKGDGYQADRAVLIWKLYALCTVVSIVCTLVAGIPVIEFLAGVAGIIAGIVEVVAMVLYVIFLYKASESLLS